MNAPCGPMANPIDLHVGRRIRLRLSAIGMSQSALADRLGLTFQQVQKYERGAYRVSASKLYEIAKILRVSLIDSFEGLPPTASGEEGTGQRDLQPTLDRLMDTRDREALAVLFPQIERPSLRRAIVGLVRAVIRPE